MKGMGPLEGTAFLAFIVFLIAYIATRSLQGSIVGVILFIAVVFLLMRNLKII